MPQLTPELHQDVLAAMDAAAKAEILPRWRALEAGDVRTKSAEWDVVTDADVLAEEMLTASLRQLIDIPVVGEEATAANPALQDLVGSADACWVVDPVDGTRNFVNGQEDFACMVALVVGGRTQGAWITHPVVGRSMWAGVGQGTFIDGERIQASPPPQPDNPRGSIGARLFISDPESIQERANRIGTVEDIRFCAGWDYFDLISGAKDYVLFSRSLPWDHAPGGLMSVEAGLRVGRFDGSEYLPGDGRKGLLIAHPTVWEGIRDGLQLERA